MFVMTGIVNREALEVLGDQLVGLPIMENWFAVETTDGKIVMKIWKGFAKTKELAKNPKIRKVFMPLVIKAHNSEEARIKFREKLKHYPNFRPFIYEWK